ncbi:MAG: DUF1311 domain-containing protein [Candidatus Riflebacteria bacterium]|nr:DUF1311 domain-containing protein [Candidatus Riflebacteria bacterium]
MQKSQLVPALLIGMFFFACNGVQAAGKHLIIEPTAASAQTPAPASAAVQETPKESSDKVGADESEKQPIDTEIDKMIAANPGTNGEVQAYEKGVELWDKELNRVYKELQKELVQSPAAKEALTQTQRTWMSFRDKEFELLDAIYAKKDGSMYHSMHACDRMKIVRQRVMALAHLLEIIKE